LLLVGFAFIEKRALRMFVQLELVWLLCAALIAKGVGSFA
jgi:hypothetical protein